MNKFEYKRSETFFKGYDHTKLFLQKWSQLEDNNCGGTILFTHGQGEHSECYNRLIQFFLKESNLQDSEKKSWNFIGWDLRGHGKSEGLRGYAQNFDEYINDYNLFLELCLKLPEVQNKPVILLSHSMGGLIQEQFLMQHCSQLQEQSQEHKQDNQQLLHKVSAQILSSPLFGVAVKVPGWKDSGAQFLNSLLPKITLGNEIKNSDLTRDPEVIREYEQDTYRHHRISSGVYLGMKENFPLLFEQAQQIQIPTFLHISDNDPVVSSTEALRFFDLITSENKGLKIIEGGKHELYNDICRLDVFKSVFEFLKPFLQK